VNLDRRQLITSYCSYLAAFQCDRIKCRVQVGLDIECLDRIYLNGYLPNLQVSCLRRTARQLPEGTTKLSPHLYRLQDDTLLDDELTRPSWAVRRLRCSA
jgi:hypothetical protein